MATLVNYKYDKNHDYIVKTESPQNKNQLGDTRRVIYDSSLLNALREAILGDTSDYSDNSGINPNLKHDNDKK